MSNQISNEMKRREQFFDDIALALDQSLRVTNNGERIGFALFTFPFSGEGEAGDYVSNAQRSHMIKFMRELADRLERGEEIPRVIGES